MAVSDPVANRRQSWSWRFLKWLIASVALLLAVGGIFQFAMTQWDDHRYPPRGKLVDIGGLRLHINCTGTGSPAVIMEAGPDDSLVSWQLVQPEISKFTRVCSYDRAGFGWSDAPNEPRSSSNVADELDRLLTRAGVPGPYVLVAFEYGALNVRMFTSRHREQVVGMVLVDPVHPDMHHRAPFTPSASTPDRFHRFLSAARFRAILWSVPLGLPRILGWCRKTYTFPNQPNEWTRLAPEAAAQYCRLRAWRTEEAQATDEDGSMPAKTGPFGDMPLVMLSHDPQFGAFRRFFPPAKAAQAEETWAEMQEELRRLSSRSKRIVAKGSDRYVQIYRPELVVGAVQEIVNDARGAAPFEADPETEYK